MKKEISHAVLKKALELLHSHLGDQYQAISLEQDNNIQGGYSLITSA